MEAAGEHQRGLGLSSSPPTDIHSFMPPLVSDRSTLTLWHKHRVETLHKPWQTAHTRVAGQRGQLCDSTHPSMPLQRKWGRIHALRGHSWSSSPLGEIIKTSIQKRLKISHDEGNTTYMNALGLMFIKKHKARLEYQLISGTLALSVSLCTFLSHFQWSIV